MPDSPDAVDFPALATWTYQASPGAAPQPMDVAFLQRLLTTPARACVVSEDPAQPVDPITSVAELAAHFLRDRDRIARGFVRHAHRTFSPGPQITLELAVAAMLAFDRGATRMPDLVRTYFLSDTFACSEEL
jgi:hypothetical protein